MSTEARDSRRGATLISVIVGIAILSIAATMAASTFFGASHAAKRAAEFAGAANYAEGVMEHITAQPFESIQTKEVTDGLPELADVNCSIAVTSAGEGLKEVTVTCSWQGEETRRMVRYSTLVARGGGR